MPVTLRGKTGIALRYGVTTACLEKLAMLPNKAAQRQVLQDLEAELFRISEAPPTPPSQEVLENAEYVAPEDLPV